MKTTYFILIFVLALFLNGCNTKKQNSKGNDSPTIVNLYFGQNPPGLIPEIFAPGIVSINGRGEGSISFSPDLDEVYFGVFKEDGNPSVYFSKLEDKKWTNPKEVNFTKDKKAGELHPFVSPNGEKIYFTAYDSNFENGKIWYVNRFENSWSNAIQLDSPINDDEVIHPNLTKNGDLFYFNISKRKTYYAPYKNGKFPEVQEVEFGVHAVISPTQDYIVVNARNREGERNDSDIYVYFKKKNGIWSKPINLGNEVNSNFRETSPSITPDGKYLFFSRYNEEGEIPNFYWVSTEIIHKLKTAYFKKDQEKISIYKGQDTQIDLYLKECESNGFNGSLLIVKNDSIILNKGYGFANKNKSIPNTAETVFDICSVTKQFTGAAIVKLVEEGQLMVTDSLSQYFKDIPLDKRGITIHQLLTHSAGFGHGIGNGDFDHIPQDIYFKELFSNQLRFKPGTNYSYSNSGYSVLGRIIELVSGKSYEDYLKEKLFEPSGMYHTGYLLPNWDNNSNANEYLYNVIDKGNQVSRYKQDGKIAWALKANGGINSTQNDMYKWYLALKNNNVLSESSIEKLTTPYVAENEDESSYYGYGWAIFESNRNSKVISHNGFNGVSYYEFSWFPEEDALILFATNTSTREASRIPCELEKMLFDSSYIAQPMPKSEVAQLLMFTENYSGDIENLDKALKSNFEDLLKTPVPLNRLSGVYMREKRLDKAIYIAKLNTELFPDDGNIWDTMGDIYFNAKQNDKAIESYQKAMQLKPEKGDCFWCENSQDKLEILK